MNGPLSRQRPRSSPFWPSSNPPGVRRPHGLLVIRRPDDEHTFSLLMPVRLEN
ncbi:hypothetical protein [Streptomyces sp. NPDC047453]|uniref:hypothetical protein n=1 Tax=Streptomyces sp. NPDC047453 TaxID=3154812 RepID=UPI0033D7BEEC